MLFRSNAIVNELRGEKIDIINWDDNAAFLIENALSPAKVISVVADEDAREAQVIVPDNQLSLAIGKEGQNARLAARLTTYRIDIKSETQARELGLFDEMDYDDFEDGFAGIYETNVGYVPQEEYGEEAGYTDGEYADREYAEIPADMDEEYVDGADTDGAGEELSGDMSGDYTDGAGEELPGGMSGGYADRASGELPGGMSGGYTDKVGEELSADMNEEYADGADTESSDCKNEM